MKDNQRRLRITGGDIADLVESKDEVDFIGHVQIIKGYDSPQSLEKNKTRTQLYLIGEQQFSKFDIPDEIPFEGGILLLAHCLKEQDYFLARANLSVEDVRNMGFGDLYALKKK